MNKLAILNINSDKVRLFDFLSAINDFAQRMALKALLIT